MKTILVTGGSGYIGTHTVVELVKSGYNVIIVDDFSNSDPSVLSKLYKLTSLEKGNIITYTRNCGDNIDDIFYKYGDKGDPITGVIHFAAHKSVGESVGDPIKYYDNNINSLLSILRSCKKFRVNNLVFSSSCSLYGDVDELPVNESTKLSDPESPYAYTKLICERILFDFCKVNEDFNAVSLRYFNPVGAHESGMIGELPINKPNNIIPIICNSVDGVSGSMVMSVFGDDYDTKDGTCVRDYIHVSDIARAHVLSLEYQGDENYDIFNLGYESGVSVLELIKIFERVNGVKVNYLIGDRRPGDVVKIYSDSTKAKEVLGWIPEYDISDMVSSAWKWHKNYNS